MKQQWRTFAKTNKNSRHGELNNNGEHLQRKARLLGVAK
jgi:hypothetical protein